MYSLAIANWREDEVMSQAIFWGAVLRFSQAFLQSTPTILVGLAVAAIFRRLLGHENTRRLFGCGTWREVPQAWLIGMLLPICSLGVIPVAREMRRARIAGGTILAFAMTAPLFNPLSLLYGLTLSEPFVILSFAFCTLLVVTAVGLAWGWLFPGVLHDEPAPAPVAYGLKRMAALLVAAAREVTGPSFGYVFISLLGVIVLSVALPPGSLQSTMEHTNHYAPLAMTVVAVPAYTPPLMAMSQIGSMFQHANSVGAAFVLLTLGAGINLGLIAWVFRNYGLHRGFTWMGILLTVVLAIAYAIENPLFPDEIEPPGHTHAFDIYCRPFGPDTNNLPAAVMAKLKESLQPVERVGMIVLGSLFAFGLILRAVDRRWRIEDWPVRRVCNGAVRPAVGGRFSTGRPGAGGGGGYGQALVGARGIQHRGLLPLLPLAARNVRGNADSQSRGSHGGQQRQSETRRPLYPDLGRMDTKASSRSIPARGHKPPLPPDEDQGLSRPPRVPEARS